MSTFLRVCATALLAVLILFGIPAAHADGPQLAITFDDLPAHGPLPPGETRLDIATKVIGALQAAHLPPTYGFVNAVAIEQDPASIAVLGAWRGAGYPLGNHTWSHMNFNHQSIEQFEGDILRDEPILQLEMHNADFHWFRFPFLAEGDTMEKRMGIRVFLADHGYKIAAVTMSFADYAWNEPYARCMAKHDTSAVRRLEHSYLAAADQSIHNTRAMSQTLYSHDIPYVLLMHIGAFDARMLPRLLDLYKRRGFTFVPLDKAEADPFYRTSLDPKLLPEPDTLEGVMMERHLPFPPAKNYGADLDKVCR